MRRRRAGLLSGVLLLGAVPAAGAPSVEGLGDVGQVALPAAALLLSVERRDVRGAVQLGEAYAVTLAATQLLKARVHRRRPDGGARSFPSGHTASAFVGAAFVHRRYGWAWGVPAYLAAGFVGYSRVEARRHWTSDVVAGAALGIGASLVLTRHRGRVAVGPAVGASSAGACVVVAW